MKPSLVLLNPPSDGVHIRDLYCSISSKGNYCWAPIDLLAASGRLAESFQLTVVDAAACGLSRRAALRKVLEARPDAVLSLSGSASWPKDMEFLREINRVRGCRIAVSGDLCLDTEPWLLSLHPWLGALAADFTSPSLAEYFQGAAGRLGAVAYREGERIIDCRDERRSPSLDFPLPRHELFPLRSYRIPYVRRYPVATVLTSLGCPFTCSYCIQNRTVMGYRLRPLASIEEELDYLKALGVRELYLRDPLFGAAPAHARAFCGAVARRGFAWSCNSRVDVIDEDLAERMRASGCTCVAFGLESANEEVLSHYEKEVTREQALRAIGLCRKKGIQVAGYFILGLPGESRESMARTIEFSRRSGIDYASFAVASPDYGTRLRHESIAAGRIDGGYRHFNRSRASLSLTPELGERELQRLLRRATAGFYGRPSYMLKTLLRVRSLRQFYETVRATWSVLSHCL